MEKKMFEKKYWSRECVQIYENLHEYHTASKEWSFSLWRKYIMVYKETLIISKCISLKLYL